MDRREMSELLVRREEVRLVPYICSRNPHCCTMRGSWSFSALNCTAIPAVLYSTQSWGWTEESTQCSYMCISLTS